MRIEKSKIKIPEQREKLEEAYLAAIQQLIRGDAVSLDEKGNPYWSSCGIYLDGSGHVTSSDDAEE